MISGIGVKNKILEAMSMEKAIVSTIIGASGIECEDNKNILLATDSNIFENKIIDLFSNKELREKLGINARKLILGKYLWEHAIERYENVYNKITSTN